MIFKALNKLKRTTVRFSIRLTVVAVFVLATSITAIVATSLQYYFSEKMALESNLQHFHMTTQSVADYLTAAGIGSDRLTVKGMGEENPVADNSTREGREKNRRVEVVVPSFEYQELVQPE